MPKFAELGCYGTQNVPLLDKHAPGRTGYLLVTR